MKNSPKAAPRRLITAAVVICFGFSSSGCSTLKSGEYEQFGYKGTPVVEEGRRCLPLDILGNIFGAFEKLILFNWKVQRHRITEPTQTAVNQYLETHPELGDVSVQLNRWSPGASFKRLFSNKKVKWPYRYTLGLLEVLFIDVLLVDRLFGGDRYNPFTHMVHLHSDLPSIALHELGHAQDFAGRRYRGSYALTRILPFVDLYQEYKATGETLRYTRQHKLYDVELESYRVLYPAYGTYAGNYTLLGFGSVIGAVVGHIIGRREARVREKELRAQKLI